MSLEAEARRVIAQARCWGGRSTTHLVGHSFGAAVALRAAHDAPDLFSSVTLIEPVSFHLLRNRALRDRRLFGEAAALANDVGSRVASGDMAMAAARFCDYWNGRCSWGVMSDRRRDALSARMPMVVGEFWATMQDALRPKDLQRIPTPALILTGSHTPATTRRIAELIVGNMPTAMPANLRHAGHMLPLTHGELAGRHIARHIAVVDSLNPQAA